MNIFVLNSGRCGSTTFIRACSHITNYTSAHESRTRLVGADRFAYPPNHIEADNRLSWLLGRLQRHYPNEVCYVHLTREIEACTTSFVKRAHFGIIKAYREGILMGASTPSDEVLAADYLDTVESNIALFLSNKPVVYQVRLEQAETDFKRFWKGIGAQGDLSAALAEWRIRHNAS
ncbi:MAG: hypothetical protein P8171_04925 [Candidatus Thiodiazotropha sp.]|jgi:hypothetical protein